MTTVFLVMFLVGFGLTAISALLGSLHFGGGGHDFGHGGHADFGHGGHADFGHGGHADLGAGHGAGAADGHGAHVGNAEVTTVSAVNYQTLVAFSMGFGGVGYVVSRLGLAGLLLAIPLALAGGVGSAWLVFRFLKFLTRGERELLPTSYVGVVGQLTVPIRTGGTGEMVYSQNDVRQVTAARSADGKPLAKGEEVVVLRHESGVAYVQRWTEFMDQAHK